MYNVKDMVKGGKQVTFAFYRTGELFYRTECGFEFPVPIDDCGTGIFLAKDKAMLFMRYIRKHIARLEEEAANIAKAIEVKDGGYPVSIEQKQRDRLKS